ncbi:MAG: sodium:solute symporter, partial [Clostridia bacterium]|nr:sodium:solute symporter [Clostridia bacterium]
STFFAIVVAGGCYFMGGFGRLYADKIVFNPNTGAPVYDSIVPSMLEGLPDVIVAIVIMLVLSASMSTLSSLVLTSSSTLTLDMIVPMRKKETSQKTQMLIIRVLLVFFIVISAVIAIIQTKSSVTFIAQLMGISWGALAGAFLAPYLISLYSKKVTKASVWVSFVTGVGIMIANMICTFAGVPFINAFFSSPINAGVLAMVVGLVVVPVVSLFTKKPDQAEMDRMFECYDRTMTVKASTALEDEAK